MAPPLPDSDPPFPILPIALLSLMGTAFLLAGLYVIATKCCPICPQWLTLWRAQRSDDSFIALSPTMWINRGLNDAVIREIPTSQYRRGESDLKECINGCVVCLNEFQEQDMLRVLPQCNHAFHLDCIDVWFQNNENCPLCRTSLSSGTAKHPFDRIIAPTTSPQGSVRYTDSLIGGDEDYVVIELGGEGGREQETMIRRQSPMKIMEQNKVVKLRERKRKPGSSMGDECIDIRGKDGDDRFSIQPIRRSFSMDSAVGQKLYLSVQEIIQHQRGISVSTNEESSNRARRPFFSFSHGRGSRNAILPIEFEP